MRPEVIKNGNFSRRKVCAFYAKIIDSLVPVAIKIREKTSVLRKIIERDTIEIF